MGEVLPPRDIFGNSKGGFGGHSDGRLLLGFSAQDVRLSCRAWIVPQNESSSCWTSEFWLNIHIDEKPIYNDPCLEVNFILNTST